MSPLLCSRARQDRSPRTAELLARCRAEPPGEARKAILNDVVEVNLGVADSLAARYARRGVPEDDLVQVARTALVKASRAYRPDLGDDFLSYAVPCIRGELRRHFRDAGWMVRPPRRVQEAQYRVLDARSRLTSEFGHEPTPKHYATELDLDEGTVVEALTLQGCFHAESLDRSVRGHDGSPTTIGERLGDEDDEFDRSEARVVLAPLIQALPARDRTVLRLRFVDGLTQREVGDQIGVTQMQVSRILSRILRHLREQLVGVDEEPGWAAAG